MPTAKKKTTAQRPTPKRSTKRPAKAKAVKFPSYPAKPNGNRELTAHQSPGNPLNNAVRVHAMDDPGPGGANHLYQVNVPHRHGTVVHDLAFQKGGVQEAGVNGLSNEVLLAIVKDRLEGFQSGPFACEANHIALTGVETALEAMQSRTTERTARGVEGTRTA